ncbi:Concanavalin A-like lectin/glucanase, subgroup [Artemisia annua]|uniref:Concanavalin A-like lectin/glucanase, subgroup n=1 Tax=Artemisia annua TaxID=35608 RepID=A0A2U1QHQ9_ARTAN|nr:Concanavalin A-like lectin/glucanase, subgroup [Artemisia annua]
MMKCFTIFNSKKGRSSPELGEQNPSRRSNTRLVKSTGSISSPRSIPELYKEKGHSLRKFSFSELRHATNGFNRMYKIGEGGFGSVYKGSIKPSDGQGDPVVVAIKKLNRNGMQGHKEWFAEVQFLAVVEHPNLVKLLGYCSADGERGIQRLLVYEYMPNKSLEDHLFSRALPPIPWIRRLKILLGAAEGLAYLHEGLEIQVIFRDFKSSNVLLDQNFNAKLSDFGLAREGPQGDRTHVSTMPVGTYGYAAPEYVETGHLKSNSDLYSFGVVLYEILTGRKAIDRNLPQSEQKLLEWVKQFPADSKRFRVIMDPRLNNQYSLEAARKIAKLADTCLRKNPDDRPAMSRIVDVLREAIRESENVNNSQFGSPLPEPSTRRMVHAA